MSDDILTSLIVPAPAQFDFEGDEPNPPVVSAPPKVYNNNNNNNNNSEMNPQDIDQFLQVSCAHFWRILIVSEI